MRFAVVLVAGLFMAQAQEMGLVRKLTENKFVTIPGLPSCFTQAVLNGDPTKGPAVIVFKAPAGCMAPWHWHTPTEQIMMVNGSAKVEMKHGPSAVISAGGYAKLPSKHIHQFTCTTACTAFVTSDAAFDIHYVDQNGKEISPDEALKNKTLTSSN